MGGACPEVKGWSGLGRPGGCPRGHPGALENGRAAQALEAQNMVDWGVEGCRQWSCSGSLGMGCISASEILVWV